MAAKHREQLATQEFRIRTETNKERQEVLAQGRQEVEDRFAREREQAKIDAEKRRREWENQKKQYRRLRADLKEKREEERIEMVRLTLEVRKSRAFLYNNITAVSRARIRSHQPRAGSNWLWSQVWAPFEC